MTIVPPDAGLDSDAAFRDFTRENYRSLLRLAKARYVFRGFTDFRPEERFVLWRHDVDYSLHAAARFAAIEAEEGIASTYLVHLHSEYYNLLDATSREKVETILSLGHTLGLHFDSHYYGIEAEAPLEANLAAERRILEAMFGVSVDVFSFHNSTPFTMGCRNWRYADMIHVHADYFQQEVGYCSDSNGYWRYRRLEDVLRAGTDARLQVLTHPELWQDLPMSPAERIRRCIDGRAEAGWQRYCELLAAHNRRNVGLDRIGQGE